MNDDPDNIMVYLHKLRLENNLNEEDIINYFLKVNNLSTNDVHNIIVNISNKREEKIKLCNHIIGVLSKEKLFCLKCPLIYSCSNCSKMLNNTNDLRNYNFVTKICESCKHTIEVGVCINCKSNYCYCG